MPWPERIAVVCLLALIAGLLYVGSRSEAPTDARALQDCLERNPGSWDLTHACLVRRYEWDDRAATAAVGRERYRQMTGEPARP